MRQLQSSDDANSLKNADLKKPKGLVRGRNVVRSPARPRFYTKQIDPLGGGTAKQPFGGRFSTLTTLLEISFGVPVTASMYFQAHLVSYLSWAGYGLCEDPSIKEHGTRP